MMEKICTLCAGLLAATAFLLALFGEAFIGAGANVGSDRGSIELASEVRARLKSVELEIKQQGKRLERLEDRTDSLAKTFGGASPRALDKATRDAASAQVRREVQARWGDFQRRGGSRLVRSPAPPKPRTPVRPTVKKPADGPKKAPAKTVPPPARKAKPPTRPATPRKSAPRPRRLTTRPVGGDKKADPQAGLRKQWTDRIQRQVKLPADKAGKIAALLVKELNRIKKIWTVNAADTAKAEKMQAAVRAQTDQKVQALLSGDEFQRYLDWRKPKPRKLK